MHEYWAKIDGCCCRCCMHNREPNLLFPHSASSAADPFEIRVDSIFLKLHRIVDRCIKPKGKLCNMATLTYCCTAATAASPKQDGRASFPQFSEFDWSLFDVKRERTARCYCWWCCWKLAAAIFFVLWLSLRYIAFYSSDNSVKRARRNPIWKFGINPFSHVIASTCRAWSIWLKRHSFLMAVNAVYHSLTFQTKVVSNADVRYSSNRTCGCIAQRNAAST